MRRGRCSLAGSVLFSHYEPNRSPNLVPQGHHTTYCGNPKTGQNSLRSKYTSQSRSCEPLRLPGMLSDSGNSYRVIGSSFHASVIYISLTELCRSSFRATMEIPSSPFCVKDYFTVLLFLMITNTITTTARQTITMIHKRILQVGAALGRTVKVPEVSPSV